MRRDLAERSGRPGRPARGMLSLGLWLATSALLVGCFASHRCGEETCDYSDSDCDGRVDEDFLDARGRYADPNHCGGCNVRCADVFPTAAETACVSEGDALPDAGVVGGEPRCVLVRCPVGWHRAGEASCAPDVPAACAPCRDDEDCVLRLPGATCRAVDDALDRRCLEPCVEGGCPVGFVCDDDACAPVDGTCACTPAAAGAVYSCLVTSPDGDFCAGSQRCTVDGLEECEAVLDEVCDGNDEDCDGLVDEDFLDEEGRHTLELTHCGACDRPCAPPGPNMVARCEGLPAPRPEPEGPVDADCFVECLEGFVDVDGLPGNGCECERWDGEGPPPSAGGDADCDGLPDDDDRFVYVTPTGRDSDPGTLARPMRSLDAALRRGATLGRSVLVAGGVYDAPVRMVEGVDAYGGYRTDFRDRDLGLYAVTLTNTAAPGEPVVVCRGITAPTRFEGFEIVGSDAVNPGGGSSALYSDGCGAEVHFASMVVVAGRGAAGLMGDDSADNLGELDPTLTSLAQLEGRSGTEGGMGTSFLCSEVAGGRGGAMRCGSADVSGGAGARERCDPIGCRNGEPCPNAGCTDYTVNGVCDLDTVLALAVPNPSAEDGRGRGAGGAGRATFDAPTNRAACNFCDDNPTLPRNGQDGEDGTAGRDGVGGVGCDAEPGFDPLSGRLSGAVALRGEDGAAGSHGSGGGGGSSGAGYAVIGGTFGSCSDQAGGGGGGGGSGGCGAPRAEGGMGGGTSAGLVIRPRADGTGPLFESTRVRTESGGAGGDGGVGAAGGQGGSGRSGGVARFWCARNGGRGGDGGDGGAAGGGGGGCGGDTRAVALVGSAPIGYEAALQAGIEVERVGIPGRPGRGGYSPGSPGGDGRAGRSGPIGRY